MGNDNLLRSLHGGFSHRVVTVYLDPVDCFCVVTSGESRVSGTGVPIQFRGDKLLPLGGARTLVGPPTYDFAIFLKKTT